MQKEHSTIGQHIRIIPLIENIKLAKIATQMQDMLAVSPVLRMEERNALDSQLVDWFDKLPWALKSTDPCPESLYIARTCLKWRYQNTRIVLFRPVLLNLANRGNSYIASPDELAAVELCRAIARETIEDISREFTRNQMSGWNGVWFMYQASMVPLLSVFWESWNQVKVREWHSQIEMVIDAFAEMTDWSLAARRSREVVSKMYEASKAPIAQQGRSPGILQNSPHSSLGQNNNNNNNNNGGSKGIEAHFNEREMPFEMDYHQLNDNMMMEEGMIMLDDQNIWDVESMLWGNINDGLDIPYESVPEMTYADSSQGNYDGPYLMHG